MNDSFRHLRRRTFRPPSTAQLAIRGLLFASAVGALCGALFVNSQGTFRHDPTVTAEISSIGDGLPVGTDVKMRGVIVGRISEVATTAGKRNATLRITFKPEFVPGVPASVRARVIIGNVFAQPAIELVPGRDDQTMLKSGAQIPEDSSVEAVQIQTAIDKAYDLLTAVKPAEISVAMNAISSALDGNGKKLGDLIVRSDRYLSTLNTNADTFAADVTAAATAIHGLKVNTPNLLDAVDDALIPARTFAAKQDQLAALLASGIGFGTVSEKFLKENKERIITVIHDTRPVTEALAEDKTQIAGSFRRLGAMAALVHDVPDREPDGPDLALDIRVQAGIFAPYSSKDCPIYAATAGKPAARGANCDRDAATSMSQSQVPAGNVGPVGSAQEHALIADILKKLNVDGTDKTAGTGDAGDILLAPLLRGLTLESR